MRGDLALGEENKVMLPSTAEAMTDEMGTVPATGPRLPGVSIVDNDESPNLLLCQAARLGHCRLMGSFTDPVAALQRLSETPPDLVLIDTCLPGMSGFECAHRLKTVLPQLAVIMLTASPDGPTLLRSLMAGASGFLPKPFSIPQLLGAIQQVRQGEFAFGKLAQPYLARFFQQLRQLAEESSLTERQEQMLACIFQGLPNKEIASHLRIGTSTVHTHLHRLFKRLGVHSRKQLIGRYLQLDDLKQTQPITP